MLFWVGFWVLGWVDAGLILGVAWNAMTLDLSVVFEGRQRPDRFRLASCGGPRLLGFGK